MSIPFFSVIIPTFNRVGFLDRVIGYLVNQTFDDFEVIVVDDGSTDDTPKWAASLEYKNVHCIRQANQGVCAARNTGIMHANGKYIAFLDTDDYVSENWLHDFYSKISEDAADLVICRRALEHGGSKEDFRFLAGAFAVRKSLLTEIGGYDTAIKFGENTELKWRIDKAGAKIIYINSVNFRYNNGSGGGGSNLNNKVDSFYYVIKKHSAMFRQNPMLAQQYYQIAGVNCYKLGRLSESRNLMIQGYLKQPSNMKALARMVKYYLKSLAKKETV